MLHFYSLGKGSQINPVTLQNFYRGNAYDLRDKRNDEFHLEILNSVITPSDFVDSSILTILWPTQLNTYRVCIVAFNDDTNSRITSIVTYTPLESTHYSNGLWTGTPDCDIMLKLYRGHYTLMHVVQTTGPRMPIETYLHSLQSLNYEPHIQNLHVHVSGSLLNNTI